MNAKANLSIHNRFDIVVRNAETGEVEQRAQAENIVLDRMYTRLCAFQTYFENIVYGRGTGTPTADGTTLFSRIGSMAASTEELVRSSPTSTWTRKIRLGTGDNNGETLTEVGISDTTTYINTHALITDAEGHSLALEKTALRIIDIYSTVYITLYDVDRGLYFDGAGLRNYLTGASMDSDSLGLALFNDFEYLPSIRTSDAANKKVKTAVRFNVQHYNKEVRRIRWSNVGLVCELPRTGLFTGYPITGATVGTGDGTQTVWSLPQRYITDLVVYVDGINNLDWARDALTGLITFGTPPAPGLSITADYTCTYQPKDVNHVLDVSMEIQFAASQPAPVMPDRSIVGPGSLTPIAGTTKLGFFGEVPAANFITGADLCNAIGLTAGTLQYSDEPWLKYAKDTQTIFITKKPIKHSISWDSINAAGAVYGDKIIELGGVQYAITLMTTDEWNQLIYPVHVDYGQWAQYSDADIVVGSGDGRNTWTSTPILNSPNRISRGRAEVADLMGLAPSFATKDMGFRPVLRAL